MSFFTSNVPVFLVLFVLFPLNFLLFPFYRILVFMRYIGIDVGTKRVGIAMSDPTGSIASPFEVWPWGRDVAEKVAHLAHTEKAVAIVIGESKDYKGQDNAIMKEIGELKRALVERGLTVYMHPEFMTSAQAAHIQGETAKHDASAAAIILQAFLDQKHNGVAIAPVSMDVIKAAATAATATLATGTASASASSAAPLSPSAPAHISYDDFKKVEIRAGKILSAEKVPNADKLLRLMVDFAEAAPRQIVSGIAADFPDPSVLVGKTTTFVTNLEPRTIRGLESNGMLFALSSNQKKEDGTVARTFALLEPKDIPPGTLAG